MRFAVEEDAVPPLPVSKLPQGQFRGCNYSVVFGSADVFFLNFLKKLFDLLK